MKQLLLFSYMFILLLPTLTHALDESDLHAEDVTVLRVSDGDTLEVRFADFTEKKVRMLGIQAFEEHDDSSGIPDCNATNATDRLAEILGCDLNDNCPDLPTVTLKVWDTTQTNYGRPIRYVFMDNGAGEEVNVGLQLVKEGYVLAFSHSKETLYNNDLWLAQQNAIDKQIGPLWNSAESQCADGPGKNTQLDMWVNWDAPGNDNLPENSNGEWIKIKNNGSSAVNLSYWKLRDTGQQHPFEFPLGTSLPAGQTITVYAGDGDNDGTSFYMNQSSPIFENFIPEGAYLLDYWDDHARPGEIRASFTYPCLQNCKDPLQGKIVLNANYDAEGNDNENPNGEWVDINNISSVDANMERYLLHSDPVGSATFNFDGNSLIHSGETMRVYIGLGSSSRLNKYWGNSTSILANEKDRVWIDTYNSIQIAEDAWPKAPEPPPGKIILAPIIDLLNK